MKTWFITGASRGFGPDAAKAALSRGDKVAPTARNLANVADLTQRFGDAALPLALDVTDADQVQQVVAQAHAHFGGAGRGSQQRWLLSAWHDQGSGRSRGSRAV